MHRMIDLVSYFLISDLLGSTIDLPLRTIELLLSLSIFLAICYFVTFSYSRLVCMNKG